MAKRMTDLQFRALLDWWMVSDPWPLSTDGWQHQELEALIVSEAQRRGYDGWADAYHEFKVA